MSPVAAVFSLSWASAAALSAVVALCPLAAAQDDGPEPPAAAKKLEKFEFSCRTLGGQQLTQAAFAEQVLIVDFWGTWCGPCRESVPHLASLYGKYRHHGLEIVGFNYAADGSGEDEAKVRAYASEKRIPYALAIGEKSFREQVPDFGGYPTMLFFKKGLAHDKTKVGFEKGDEVELEKWVREALGLDAPAATADPKSAEEKRIAAEVVPEGKIWIPEKAATGFDFEVDDADGKTIRFEDFRGAPVLVVLTTTWDRQAKPTAALLASLRASHPTLRLVAGCLEKGTPEERQTAIRAFRTAEKIDYPLFAAELQFALQKVHRFAALPTLLLFDAQGALVLRESGLSDAITERLNAKIAALAK